jgi:Fe-S-cluster containining protein
MAKRCEGPFGSAGDGPRRVALRDRTPTLPPALRRSPTDDPAAWRAAGGQPTCQGCVAHCCRYVCVEIDTPRAKWQFDQIHWMLMHADVAVFVGPHGLWYTEFRARCAHLADDNRCTVYEQRPNLCRSYASETCPVWAEGRQHRLRFEDASAFAAYLDGRGLDWRYHDGRPGPRSPAGRPLPAPSRRPQARTPGPAPSGGAGRAPDRSPRG